MVPDNCTDGEVLFISHQRTPNVGLPKFCLNQHWSYICGNYWDTSDGNVLCGELGFQYGGLSALVTPSACIPMDHCAGSSSTTTAISSVHQASNGSSPFPIRFNCYGQEEKLSDCSQYFIFCQRIVSQLKCTGWSLHM